MKIRATIPILLLPLTFWLSPLFITAQWFSQNSGTNSDLKSIYFTDDNNGWAVGSEGIILHTDNGGGNWNVQFSGIDYILNSVFFINTLYGWTVGDKQYPDPGIILRTTDGGDTWEEVYVDSHFHLTDIFFSDSSNGCATGELFGMGCFGILLQSTDGGETWVEKDSIPPFSWPPSLPLRDIHFIDSDNGWVAGGGVAGSSGYTYCFVMKTYDGGSTWEEKFNHGTSPGGPIIYPPLSSIYFTDINMGWAVGSDVWSGSGSVLHTFDGGITWEIQYISDNTSLLDIKFTDPVTGWVVGADGTILYTENGGENWDVQESGTTFGLTEICFTDENNGWISGDSGLILHTDNGGVVGVNELQVQNSRFQVDCYPNPTFSNLEISYHLHVGSKVDLRIYDIQGNEVRTLLNRKQAPEKYSVHVETSDLPAGIYLVRLRAGEGVETVKLVVLR
jgi:photosystem II stability/assembly factor-like uncharacterized protein